jgi:hypothetical protein
MTLTFAIVTVIGCLSTAPPSIAHVRVLDLRGYAVPAANVTVSNSSGLKQTTVADRSGTATFELAAGSYTVAADLAGFRPCASIALPVARRRAASVTLRMALCRYVDAAVPPGATPPPAYVCEPCSSHAH